MDDATSTVPAPAPAATGDDGGTGAGRGAAPAPSRRGERRRTTKESDVLVVVELDGSGQTEIATGLPFFDHMLSQLGRHGGLDLVVRTTGDLDVDAHHSVEDTGITLGEEIGRASCRERVYDDV